MFDPEILLDRFFILNDVNNNKPWVIMQLFDDFLNLETDSWMVQ